MTASHGGKKMWCIPGELDKEYIARMENILDLLGKPICRSEPVVCLDERPVQLHAEIRQPLPVARGRIRKRDSEYRRRGTANVFAIVAPLEGHHLTMATRNRKSKEFAKMLGRISRRYPDARKIHLIMDNLNTHSEKSLIKFYGEKMGNRLWNRFNVHYTPKHGSWLNPAEIEISLFSRECLGRERISKFLDMKERIQAWTRRANRRKRTIDWKFTKRKARAKFKYSKRNN